MNDDQFIYEKLVSSEILRHEKQILGSFFKSPIWYITRDIPNRFSLTKNIILQCKHSTRSWADNRKAVACIMKNLNEAKRLKNIQKFQCLPSSYGFVLPLAQGDKVYGYIILCHADKEISEAYAQLFKVSLDTLIKEIQKELELTKLYDTIRPRAIALSTIHTIHRLINSTLDLDELLPRIARLSIQVMRANRCSIKLLDRKKKALIPKTTVDLRKNKRIRLKKLPVGKGVPGRTAKLGKSIRGKNYISVPLIDEDMIGVITVYDKVNQTSFNEFDQEILTTLAEQAVIAIKNAQFYKEQQDVIVGSVKSLAMLMGARTPHAHKYFKIISRLTIEVGRQMGMDDEELRSLEVASLLHDAGEVSVPDGILAKPAELTGEEYALVKEHPAKGAKIIEPLKALKPAIPIILHHHEKYDGSGYPKGLKGDNIPLGARIMAVIGAFEAMVALRPYRQNARSVDEAIEETKKNSGTQFDPKIVNVFVKVVNKPGIRKLLKEADEVSR